MRPCDGVFEPSATTCVVSALRVYAPDLSGRARQRCLWRSGPLCRSQVFEPRAVVRHRRHLASSHAQALANQRRVRITHAHGSFRRVRSPAARVPRPGRWRAHVRAARFHRTGGAQAARVHVESRRELRVGLHRPGARAAQRRADAARNVSKPQPLPARGASADGNVHRCSAR